MLSAVSFDTESGQLDISLTGSDSVAVEVFDDLLQVSVNGALVEPIVDPSEVTFISVQGGSGANDIDLSGISASDFSFLPASTSVTGGAGNDTIVGSGLMDIIDGNSGDDSISGGLG